MSWPLVKLGDFVTHVSSGATPKGGSSNYLKDGPVMFLRSQNVYMNELRLDDVIYISKEIHQKMSRSVVRFGDVLINITGASIGRVTPFELKDKAVNSNQHVCTIRPDSSVLDYKYLSYFLGSNEFQHGIFSSQRGGTREALNYSQIREFKIPLPYPDDPEKSLKEQKRIAAILDKADGIRRKREQAIQLTDDFLRSVFLDMFGDPVTNPKGWEVKTIEELVVNKKGAIKRGPFGGALKKEIFVDSGYLVYEQYHALNNDFSFARYYINEETFSSLSGFEVKPGDLIISCSGVNLGRLACIPENAAKGIINQALLKITLNESVMSNAMFMSIFRHPNFKNEFFGNTRGSGVPNFPPMSAFKEFKFICPPVSVQRKYFDKVERCEQLKVRLLSSAEKSNDTFNSLSQKAFKGEL